MKFRFGRPPRFLSSLAMLALSLGLSGCGSDGPERFRVSGTIEFNGQPAPAGTIHFDPDSSKGNDGPQGFAQIKQGRYDTAQDGAGVIGGPHRVRINVFDGVGTNDDAPYGRPLRLAYETTKDMPTESTTADFEVPASPGR